MKELVHLLPPVWRYRVVAQERVGQPREEGERNVSQLGPPRALEGRHWPTLERNLMRRAVIAMELGMRHRRGESRKEQAESHHRVLRKDWPIASGTCPSYCNSINRK